VARHPSSAGFQRTASKNCRGPICSCAAQTSSILHAQGGSKRVRCCFCSYLTRRPGNGECNRRADHSVSSLLQTSAPAAQPDAPRGASSRRGAHRQHSGCASAAPRRASKEVSRMQPSAAETARCPSRRRSARHLTSGAVMSLRSGGGSATASQCGTVCTGPCCAARSSAPTCGSHAQHLPARLGLTGTH